MTTTIRRRKPEPEHGTYSRAIGRHETGIPPCHCGPCALARRATSSAGTT